MVQCAETQTGRQTLLHLWIAHLSRRGRRRPLPIASCPRWRARPLADDVSRLAAFSRRCPAALQRSIVLAPTSAVDYNVSLVVPSPAGVRCPWVRVQTGDPRPTTTPNDPPQLCAAPNVSATPIRTLLKGPLPSPHDDETGDYYYMFTVNLDGVPLAAEFSFSGRGVLSPGSGSAGEGDVETVFEGGRRLVSKTASDGKSSAFSAQFEAWGTIVFRWRAPTE